MRIFCLLVAAFVFASSVVIAAEEQKDEVMVNMKSAIFSKYVDRGQVVNDDPIATSEVDIKKGMFELKLTGIMDLTDIHDNAGDFTEVDVDLGLTKEVYSNPNGIVKSIDLFGGLEYFCYPSTERESTVELYAGSTQKIKFGLENTFEARYDIDEVDGWYLSETLSRPTTITKVALFGKEFDIEATPSLGIGWGSPDYNDYYYGVDKYGFTDWNASLSLMLKNEKLEFGPSVTYTGLIDDEFRETAKDNEHVVYGFLFGYKF